MYKKLVQKLDNVLSFFELYALKNEEEIKYPKSNNVLDKWILEYLQAVINETTKWLELYQLDKASRPLMSFVEDLSTWYIRRSRDRFKSDDLGDKKDALETTRYVLGEFAKISAPFLPFYAEYLFGRIKGKNNKESVHLESWPKTKEGDKEIIENMMEVRKLVTLGLEQRSKAGVKVRQPLANLSLKNSKLESDLLGLIKDEVNVKNILVDEKIENEVLLDTNITEDLRKEGIIRDLMRAIQDLRKTEGLTVSDKIELILDSDEKGKELVNVFLKEIKKVTLITGISYGILSHKEELIIEGYRFKIDFKK